MPGICWMAPNAAANAHAIITVVTIVVVRNRAWNSSPMLGILEQLRHPRHRRHELHADADKRAAPPEQQPLYRRRIAGRECREGVQQDAPDEHPPAAEEVGEITPEQAEDASGHGRYVK